MTGKLPDTRESITRKLTIRALNEVGEREDVEMYVTVGLYPDGTPGELFLKAGKMGTTVSGLLDGVAICLSLGLQAGVPLRTFVDHLSMMRFQPSGPCDALKEHPGAKTALSVLDAVARWLELRFLPEDLIPVSETP